MFALQNKSWHVLKISVKVTNTHTHTHRVCFHTVTPHHLQHLLSSSPSSETNQSWILQITQSNCVYEQKHTHTITEACPDMRSLTQMHSCEDVKLNYRWQPCASVDTEYELWKQVNTGRPESHPRNTLCFWLKTDYACSMHTQRSYNSYSIN